MLPLHARITGLLTASALSFFTLAAHAAPVAANSYKVSIFAKSVPGAYTQPDSIVVALNHVWVGFANGVAKDGSDGKSSSIVEFDEDGVPLKVFSVPGHNDGLKRDPITGLLWALQNEDANPNLVTIDPRTGAEQLYTFAPTAHGGGYDDIVFLYRHVYLSASNPSNDPNTSQAIVEAKLVGSQVVVTPVLYGNAAALDVPDNTTVTLNLIDPDSMTSDPSSDLVLTNQAGQQLIVVEHPGSKRQKVLVFPLKYAGHPVEVDDTFFITQSEGRLLVTDIKNDAIYAIDRSAFVPGTAYSAADANGFVGQLNLETGVLTPIVRGLASPRGLAFLPANADENQPPAAACETEASQP